LFVVGTAAFAVAYCQAPLYYSNQNQYFLHGLADAGEGLLREDWLANTRDPTPVFSALVALTARFLHPWVFYLYYALLLGAYVAAMLGLFTWLVGPTPAKRRWPVFVALLLVAHAALPRWCSYRWLGLDYPWYFQAGVAGQYLLGAMFQPSTFGVLLVVAVCLFVRGRPWLAGTCAALAATLHSTYLLPAALLTLGFLTALALEGRPRRALALGAWTLLLVLPVSAYVLVTFAPTGPETFAQSQDILVNLRIPHHARPDLWLDAVAGLQTAWVVLALLLLRQTRLFPVLAEPFFLGVLMTVVQVMAGSTALALLFPWRISAVLVPVATTVVLSRLVAAPGLRLDGPLAWAASAVVVAGLVGAGIWITAARLGFRTADEEEPVMDFVARHRAPGDVYLLPVRVPELARATRGGLSSDFKPLPEKRQDARIIPVDLQRFRLHAGAPIFVDFKAIPYKDTEVVEWYTRIRFAQAVQEQLRKGDLAGALAALRERRVTHVVLPAGQEVQGAGLEKIFEDAHYRVYRLSAPGQTSAGPSGPPRPPDKNPQLGVLSCRDFGIV
jgi:hypothetical protein